MSSVNKVIIVGRVGKDPELRQTQSGKSVGNFSVATSMKHDGKDEVEWHRIVVWDKQAENCKQYLSKGKLCYVEGRIASRKYEKDGVTHTATEIIASMVQFLSPRDEQQSKPAQQHIPKIDFDDVPF